MKTNKINSKQLQELISHIESLDIANYIKQEVIISIKAIHNYKLDNIQINKIFLEEYLKIIDKKNTDIMKKVIAGYNACNDQYHSCESRNLSGYTNYLSKTGIKEIGKKNINKLSFEPSNELNSIITGVKGYILLTMDEFCNASPTRIAINKLILKMENRKQKV